MDNVSGFDMEVFNRHVSDSNTFSRKLSGQCMCLWTCSFWSRQKAWNQHVRWGAEQDQNRLIFCNGNWSYGSVNYFQMTVFLYTCYMIKISWLLVVFNSLAFQSFWVWMRFWRSTTYFWFHMFSKTVINTLLFIISNTCLRVLLFNQWYFQLHVCVLLMKNNAT